MTEDDAEPLPLGNTCLPRDERSAFEIPTQSRSQTGGGGLRHSVSGFRKRPLYCLSLDLVSTYTSCNSAFRSIEYLPQRILTNPDEPHGNDGLDNSETNLICRVHDFLESRNARYTILDLLGTGTFGQVFRCQKNDTKEVVAVKVVKNKPAYYTQGVIEVKVAHMLNSRYDPHDEKHIVRLLDYFEFKRHLCLVFELLSYSVLDILQQNQFRGLPLGVVRDFSAQLLEALVVLEEANVIHCDLKPENILLCQYEGLALGLSHKLDVPEQTTAADDVVNSDSQDTPRYSKPHRQASPKPRVDDICASYEQTKITNDEVHTNTQVLGSVPAPTHGTSSYPRSDSTSSSSSFSPSSPSFVNTSSTPKFPVEAKTKSGLSVEIETSVSEKDISSNAPKQPALRGGKTSSSDRFGSRSVKLIDFGSACFEGHTMYTYIQSRFYRSPEVLLAMSYTGAIDIWSLGCVCAEMYLGLPLFPGVSQHNQLSRIIEMLGNIPEFMIQHGKNGQKFFKRTVVPGPDRSEGSRERAVLKTAEEFASETNTQTPTSRKYFRYTTLDDIIMRCPLPNRNSMTQQQKQQEMSNRKCFLDFLKGLLKLDPLERFTPKQACCHPFITGDTFRGPGTFQPPADARTNHRRFTFMVSTSSFVPLQYRRLSDPVGRNLRMQDAHGGHMPGFPGYAASPRMLHQPGNPNPNMYPDVDPLQSSSLPSQPFLPYNQVAGTSHPHERHTLAHPLQGYHNTRSQQHNDYMLHDAMSMNMGMSPQSYGQSFGAMSVGAGESAYTPLSMGASGYSLTDFGMAMQRPDRPSFTQASPTSSLLGAYAQAYDIPLSPMGPGTHTPPYSPYSPHVSHTTEKLRSTSLDHGGGAATGSSLGYPPQYRSAYSQHSQAFVSQYPNSPQYMHRGYAQQHNSLRHQISLRQQGLGLGPSDRSSHSTKNAQQQVYSRTDASGGPGLAQTHWQETLKGSGYTYKHQQSQQLPQPSSYQQHYPNPPHPQQKTGLGASTSVYDIGAGRNPYPYAYEVESGLSGPAAGLDNSFDDGTGYSAKEHTEDVAVWDPFFQDGLEEELEETQTHTQMRAAAPATTHSHVEADGHERSRHKQGRRRRSKEAHSQRRGSNTQAQAPGQTSTHRDHRRGSKGAPASSKEQRDGRTNTQAHSTATDASDTSHSRSRAQSWSDS